MSLHFLVEFFGQSLLDLIEIIAADAMPRAEPQDKQRKQPIMINTQALTQELADDDLLCEVPAP